MKPTLILIVFTFLLSSQAYSKIVLSENTFYVESKGQRKPITLLNTFAKKNKVSQVRLFSGGEVNLIAFAKGSEKEKLYSVDEEGYIYSIKPFTDYEVRNVTKDGHVQFKEEPKRRYQVGPKGLFF